MMPYQMIQPLSTSMLLNQYNVPAQFNANMDYEQLKELIRKDVSINYYYYYIQVVR